MTVLNNIEPNANTELQYRRNLEDRLLCLAKKAEKLEPLEGNKDYTEFLVSLRQLFANGTKVKFLNYKNLRLDIAILIKELFEFRRVYLLSEIQRLESMI